MLPYSNELVKKTYRLPQCCESLNQNEHFFAEQPLCKSRKFASKLLVHLSAILFVLASARAYSNHMTMLDQAVPTLPLCLHVAI